MPRLLFAAMLLAVAGCEEKKTDDPVILLAGTLGNPCREDGSCETGLTCNQAQVCALAAAIEVESEAGAAIVSGDRLDFGGCLAAADEVRIKLTIENPGDFDLQLTGTPRVTIAGPAASEYSVLEEPAAVVPAKGSTSVTLLFAPQQPGVRDATALIAHSAGAEPFSVSLSGKGTAADLKVSFNGEPLASGGALDVGKAFFSDGATTLDLTLSNQGDGQLRLPSQAVSVAGTDASAFGVALPGQTEIAPGGQAILQVRFDPATYGPKLASLSIGINDTGSSFNLRLNGTGEFNPERMRVIDETFDRSKTMSTVRIDGNRLFVGYHDTVSSGLMIYDLGAGRSAPTFAGRIAWDFDPMLESDGNVIRDIVVNGEVAYAAQGRRGVRVIDLQNEVALEALLLTEEQAIDAQDLAIDSTLGLLAVAGSDGPALYDIATDPRAPTLAHSFAEVISTTVAFAGGLLLVGDNTSYEAPQLVGYELGTTLSESIPVLSVSIDGIPSALAVSGNFVFVAALASDSLYGGLTVVDLTKAPEVKAATVKTLLSTVSVNDLVLAGTKLYASVEGNGVRIFEGADAPVDMVEVPGTIGGRGFNSIALTATELYGSTFVWGSDEGIQSFSLAEPSTAADTITMQAVTRAFAVGGGHAFLASADRGLRVADLQARGEKPAVVAIETQDGGFSFDDVAWADGRLYALSAYPSELRAFDVATPEAPMELNLWTFPEQSYGADHLLVGNGHAFVWGMQNPGMTVVDLSNPDAPQGSITMRGTVNAATLHGNYLYAAMADQLFVWDVSDPKNPVPFETPVSAVGQVAGMAAADGRLFLAVMSELQIYDLAEPGAPALVGKLATPDADPMVGVSAIGHWAFVTNAGAMAKVDGEPEVLMVDALVPADPKIRATVALRGWDTELAQVVATDRDIYLVGGNAGLLILGE